MRDSASGVMARGLETMDIARPRIFPVARPDAPWLEGRKISHAGDILKLPLLLEESDDDWRDWADAHGIAGQPITATTCLCQGHMIRGAACKGQGVALTNYFLAAEHIAAGRLVELGAGDSVLSPVAIAPCRFTARADASDSGPVRWFRDWLKAQAAACPTHWVAL